ncbi:hypothetical protein LVJ82_05690 [Vitreoscilla massiliensis]|uniref:Uncharacterized protein n=1 Tax=Vitreoscilla massiliensis TaxID=1689272 RepID=A0ABY4E6E6_9NEIS|nr:hypothetical protein [Vitreoscilla massiliensis]UOO90465.1 hypothetical protein LVJ82_05690 [Vitreoscilla massiliensis]
MKTLIVAISMVLCSNAVMAAPYVVSAEPANTHYSGADVDETIYLKDPSMNVKVFSYSGGDPAINGAYVNLAAYDDENRTWNVFPLKNVLDYKVLPSAKAGFAKIALVTQDLDRNGGVYSYKSTLFINLRNADRAGGTIEVEEIRQK